MTTIVQRPGEPSYFVIHKWVARERGRADSHACAHCGGGARQWAFDHTAASEQDRLSAKEGWAYSLDLTRYMPLCTGCHREFDTRHIVACPKGHPYTSDNILPRKGSRSGHRECRECNRESAARRARRRSKDAVPPEVWAARLQAEREKYRARVELRHIEGAWSA